ncbi:MAG: histidine kinase [Bryobacteraceae bacterium]
MPGNQSIASRSRTAGLIVAFWTVEAIYSAAQVVYRTSISEKPWSWPDALQSEFAYAWLGAALTPAIVWLAKRYPIDRHGAISRIGLHILAGAVFTTVMKLQWDLTNGVMTPSWITKGVTANRVLQSIAAAFDLGFVLYWGIVLAILAAGFYSRFRESEVESARLQTQLVQAQLHALRAQLQPHFLFNTLHGISELVHSDPLAAERMIAGLSELLRRSLDSANAAEVPLEEELAFLEIFLEIERTRFDDRLITRFEIVPETRDALVPAMILQPLVENAIRHGFARRLGGGSVTIRSALTRGRDGSPGLELVVRDDGCGVPPDAESREGVGLRSVRGRLQHLHGEASRFTLFNASGGGAEARIELPYRSAPERPAGDQVRREAAYAGH